MANVKPVISLLCKILNLSLGVNIKPEHFRLAKFNKEEENVVSQLWQILHKIFYKINFVNHPCDSGDLVNFVKLNLILKRYESMEFYCLPSDMLYGSRELLLAIGWLLASENVVEKLVVNNVRKSLLGKEFIDYTNVHELHTSNEQKSHTMPLTLDDQLNYIIWLSGTIKNNINTIEDADTARLKLMTKVHADSVGTCGLPHLSVSEAMLVRQPHRLQHHVELIEAHAQLIDTYKQWRIKSHVYWEWMDSVLDEKENSSRSHSINVSEKNHLLQFMNVLRIKVKKLIHIEEQCMTSGAHSTSSILSEPPSNGMPRFILAPHEKETELNQWLPDSEERVQALEEECKNSEEAIMKELCKLAKQMKDVEIVSRNHFSKSPKVS